MKDFCHLHTHTSYSLLDGAAPVEKLIRAAANLDMSALGITDHGVLFGVPEFYFTAKDAGIAPIIGCEFYVCDSPMSGRTDKKRYHQVLWAKNAVGYKNLCTLSSLSFLDGFYHKPRIDLETLAKYSEGLVATTCCLQGMVPQRILQGKKAEARKVFELFCDIFGDDYYIELQNHDLDDQHKVNQTLVRWAIETGVEVVATNDVHYIAREDHAAQDILLCLQTGKDRDDPNRMRFEGDQFYLKSPEEMVAAMGFLEDPLQQQALENSLAIADKCRLELDTGTFLMPHFPLPESYSQDMDGYLRSLTMEGAKERYEPLGPDVMERLNHELGIIKEMGYAGYFLIVQDFTNAARKLDVAVGPARGSAAGSAVAYCLGITNIDPLKYDLFFERFLNPERISMPDIDIDFDDRGRGKVIDYVVGKYGRDNVCQIVTFGTMGPKSAIRDVGRVLKIPLSEVDRIAKLIPDGPAVTLSSAFESSAKLRALRDDPRPEIRKLIQYAETLEGSARHTSIHAAGVIIAPGEVQEYIPVANAKSKDSKNRDALISQYDGHWVERFGLLKVDILGLSTLTILRDACDNIKQSRGIDLDLDAIPLDDDKTIDLFRRGLTAGIFQFFGDGMRRSLTQLKPTSLDDLIAMNALFRPGPMDLIPSFIRRKHGLEKAEYPHPSLEPVLKPTYGIPIYQEQVMEMAQVLAGYSLGGADVLRRAMGKKKVAIMDEQRGVFVKGAAERGVDAKAANAAFDMMQKFAGYGFNKSHSAAYALLAYQTAYLKANYTQEYIAAVMSHPGVSTKEFNALRMEARQRGIRLLPPSIHHSHSAFRVEDEHIRFGLGAVKGVQRAAIDAMVAGRKEKEKPKTLHEFLRSVDLTVANEKTLENLVRVGAMDMLDGHRAQLCAAIKPAVHQERKRKQEELIGQFSLFADPSTGAEQDPPLPEVAHWSPGEQFQQEHELAGMYISGHPLDEFEVVAQSLSTIELGDETLADRFNGKKSLHTVSCCGIITKVQDRVTRKKERMLSATLEDFTGSGTIVVFPKDVERLSPVLKAGEVVLARGELQINGGNAEILARDVVTLYSIGERMIESVAVRIQADQVAETDVDALRKLCQKNRGNRHLYLFLEDSEADGGFLRLRTRQLTIDPTRDFLKGLAQLFGAKHVRLNPASN